MKIENSTSRPDYFLRRLTAWCCRELGYPVREVKWAIFRNKSWGYSGHAYPSFKRFVVSTFPGDTKSLVRVTAHEVAHLFQAWEARQSPQWRETLAVHRAGRRRSRPKACGGSERNTVWHEKRLLEKFEAHQEQLLESWSRPPAERTPKPKLSAKEARAKKAQAKLVEWRKKLKLAQTKIRKYSKQVRYYERAAATRGEV